MRVILNTECTFFPLTGVGHYTAELARALARRAARTGDAVEAYPSGALRPVVRFWKTHVARYEARKLRPGALSKLEALARRSYLGVARRVGNLVTDDPFGRVARRGRFDLYHEPNFMAQECALPTVITVHDVSVLRHPEWHTPARVAEYEREFARGLSRACHLVAVSEFTKRETAALLDWPLERISVAYNGAREHLKPLAPGRVRARCCASTASHRGTCCTSAAWSRARTSRCSCARTARCPRGCARSTRSYWSAARGGTRPHSKPTSPRTGATGTCAASGTSRSATWPRCTAAPGRWRSRPSTKASECPRWRCSPAEARSWLRPPGAVAETVGTAAHLIDPHDEHGWRDALLRACVDDDWWNALRAGAVEAAAPFTWDRCAADTMKGYRAALGQGEAKRAA